MMTMRDIKRERHSALGDVAKEVGIRPAEDDEKLATSMLEFLKNSLDEKIAAKYNLAAGVGLAAPQLGIDKRIIAVHFDDPKGRRYSYKLFNPKIVSHSVEKAYLAGG